VLLDLGRGVNEEGILGCKLHFVAAAAAAAGMNTAAKAVNQAAVGVCSIIVIS
jgi:hypothetical protein